MKKLAVLFIVFLFTSFISCSDKCEGENPTVSLVNNGTGKADIQIKTSGGNTENINNIEIGSSSATRSFDPGNIEFTIAIQGVVDPIVYELQVFHCADYVVMINGDNIVSGTATERD
jgi:hypothetical protein